MERAMKPGFFDAADGLKLYGEWYLPAAAPRAGAVIAHGYADHSGRYGEVGQRLAALGFATLAFDYRGHGQAGGRRGHCERFDEYLCDLDRACARVRRAIGDRPLLLVAHSHGALIALRSLCDPPRTPPGVTAAVLSSPYLGLAMQVSPLKIAAGRLCSRVWPRLSMANGLDPAVVSHDPAVVSARESDRYCHKVATARWFVESTAVQRYVVCHAGRISVPTLWLVAGDDRVADAPATLRVYESAGGDKHLVKYDGFFHEVFNEVERGRVFHDMESWLSARFPGA